MTTCRLCSMPRADPGIPLTIVGDDAGRYPTGPFCTAHDLCFQAARASAYADMRIGQAVEAFCLAAEAPLPSGR